MFACASVLFAAFCRPELLTVVIAQQQAERTRAVTVYSSNTTTSANPSDLRVPVRTDIEQWPAAPVRFPVQSADQTGPLGSGVSWQNLKAVPVASSRSTSEVNHQTPTHSGRYPEARAINSFRHWSSRDATSGDDRGRSVVQTQFSAPLLPPPQPAGPSQSSPDDGQDSGPVLAGRRTIQFNFKDVPWELALRRIAEENGMSFQADRLPSGTFTFFDSHRYSPTEALDLLNDHLLPLGYILVRNGRNLILFATREAIPQNLIPFVRTSDLNILGRNELASVAIPVHHGIPQSVEQETENLVGPLGSVTSLSSSRRVLVTDTGANLRRIYNLLTSDSSGRQPSFVYQLRNTSAEDVSQAIQQFLNTQTGTQSGVVGRSSAGSTSLQAIVAEKSTNSLLVQGTVDELSVIRGLIEQLDQAPRQVLIQAVLVEVQLGNTDEFGVELGFQDSVLFNRSVIDNIVTVTETVTSPNGTQTTNDRIISQTAAPGFNFNNQPLGNNVAISPSTVAGQALSSFGTGRVNGDLGFGGLVLSAGSESVSVLLRALAANFEIDILSRPQIRALDNHEALIQIGQQVPVVDGVAVTAVGSANPVIRQDQAGIILKVTPRISPESQVMIQVNAEKSAFQLAPGTGVPIFTDATNGNVIEAPVKDITTANTTVSVQSGQTIVLGGMITKEDITVERKVPFLGDIPVIGRAFRYDFDQSERRELLIFLTPHVIDGPQHSDEIKHREIDHLHMPDSVKEFDWQIYGGGSFEPCRGPGCRTDEELVTESQLRPGLTPVAAPGGPAELTGHRGKDVQRVTYQPLGSVPPRDSVMNTSPVNRQSRISNQHQATRPGRQSAGIQPSQSSGPIQPLPSGYSDVYGNQPAQPTEPFQIYLPQRRY